MNNVYYNCIIMSILKKCIEVNMKKLISFLIVFSLLLPLYACSNQTPTSDINKIKSPTISITQPTRTYFTITPSNPITLTPKTTKPVIPNIPTTPKTSSPTIKPTQTTSVPVSDIVYITRTGEKYHRGSCRYLSKSKIPIERKEAIARGYTPCSVCRP